MDLLKLSLWRLTLMDMRHAGNADLSECRCTWQVRAAGRICLRFGQLPGTQLSDVRLEQGGGCGESVWLGSFYLATRRAQLTDK